MNAAPTWKTGVTKARREAAGIRQAPASGSAGWSYSSEGELFYTTRSSSASLTNLRSTSPHTLVVVECKH